MFYVQWRCCAPVSVFNMYKCVCTAYRHFSLNRCSVYWYAMWPAAQYSPSLYIVQYYIQSFLSTFNTTSCQLVLRYFCCCLFIMWFYWCFAFLFYFQLLFIFFHSFLLLVAAYFVRNKISTIKFQLYLNEPDVFFKAKHMPLQSKFNEIKNNKIKIK